ncbi:peptide-methionine (S)-S-oxide reductase [Desulfuromusa kysingii]|uniref:Peptide methionine sulfoxide reductase MsrA n=1 Tax=Desulfuromusa kysingii TaxID=37625 RepID=A0A1H4E6Y3_9BACT|nr:peptide-methionine (S)-S-oxide reductase MsrA [Desulfuromusa kysingii]SEA80559.1 peptide-methionine (S)-S-oxide reductase [Desulfuromusa kysingii]
MKLKRTVILCSLLLAIATPTVAATAIVAGGCFWCMESDFEKLDGVTDVISGFTGGSLEKPTYNGNHKGHYEAVEITYDPLKLSYRQLLDYYWVHIDPFDTGGQFCDRGHSYLAAIFAANDEEKRIAAESKHAVQALFPEQKIETPILSASTFWPIQGDESYHQDYYKNNPVRYKYYRWGCGRDQRLEEIWGDKAKHEM